VRGSGEPLGLYIHIPFCEVKCSYCHFAIDPLRPPPERQERYLEALLAEARRAGGPAADTVYLGGGTPSLMALDRLERLLEGLRASFAIAPNAEVTLEANPRDLDRDGYARLALIGVNRLSLGVQALDDSVLREMGRTHCSRDALQAMECARGAGFDNVSVDLILGWPGETAERFERSLDGVIALGPEHVSLYVLEVEGKTALAHRQGLGLVDLPEDDLVVSLYRDAVERLGKEGLPRYEISNFARPGRESRHNGKYWNDAPFLGFGLSAHSYGDGVRRWNTPSFVSYCRGVLEEGTARAGERRLTRREHLGEVLFTGLRRRDGIDLPAFVARYGADPLVLYRDGLEPAFEAGLLEVSGEKLRLTEAGVPLSNEVFRAFV
jgi:oxygen-independent coproporphyrinogen-3 oxidase